MELLNFSLSYKTHSVAERESWRICDEDVPLFLRGLLALPHVEGACFLATCNRIETYLSVAYGENPESILKWWRSFLKGGIAQDILPKVHRGGAVFGHLVRVASGLESMVLGENEVFGQVKKAYQTALDVGATGPLLNFTFQQAFRESKNLRNATGIGRYPTSVSTVAIKLLQEIYGDLQNCAGLVIGLGEMGRQTLKLLKDRGVKRLVLANRTYELGKKVAEELGIEAIHFEDRKFLLNQVDFVIASTGARNPILTETDFEKSCQREKPLVLIDLGLPRNVNPELESLSNVYLYNIDDLQAIAKQNSVVRLKEAALAEEWIQKGLANFEEEWLKRQSVFDGRVAQLVRVRP